MYCNGSRAARRAINSRKVSNVVGVRISSAWVIRNVRSRRSTCAMIDADSRRESATSARDRIRVPSVIASLIEIVISVLAGQFFLYYALPRIEKLESGLLCFVSVISNLNQYITSREEARDSKF